MVEQTRFADGNYRLTRADRRVDHVGSLWQERLPALIGTRVRLRELQRSDAAALSALLTTEEMTRFISAPPASREGFERFIDWSVDERARGGFVGYGVTLPGVDTAVGVFQVRRLDRNFETAEWGFTLASPFWGTGIFEEAAKLVLNFVFNTLNVHRLEARVAVRNGRGNGALLKLGAAQEGILRQSLVCHGERLDQIIYSILDEDWRKRAASVSASERVLVH